MDSTRFDGTVFVCWALEAAGKPPRHICAHAEKGSKPERSIRPGLGFVPGTAVVSVMLKPRARRTKLVALNTAVAGSGCSWGGSAINHSIPKIQTTMFAITISDA